MPLCLRVTLLSDATFASGHGVAGLLDAEVEHDELGLPLIRGRTLKGLLVEGCDDALYALRLGGCSAWHTLLAARDFLFGRAGSGPADDGAVRLGGALLPDSLRIALAADIHGGRLTAAEVLESLTTVRASTALDPETGSPEPGSLRAWRAVLRGTAFTARVDFAEGPSDLARGLFAASVLLLRRGGSGRNRGRGRLEACLLEDGADVTQPWYEPFRAAVAGGAA